MLGIQLFRLVRKITFLSLSLFFILIFNSPAVAAVNSHHAIKKETASAKTVLTQNHLQMAPSWHFIIAPYGWISGLRGDMVIRNNLSHLDVTPHDILNLLSDIDFIGEIHMEAQHGPLDLMLDALALKLSVPLSRGPLGVTVTPSIAIVDFGGFYTVLTNPAMHDATTPVKLQLFGGGRYFKMKLKISPKRLPSISGSQNVLAPIVGARIIFPIDKKFTLVARGDIGGFNFDDTDSTWSASVMGQYAFTKCVKLAVGYRALGMHFMKNVAGTGTQSGMNMTFYGPIIGIIFKI